MPRTTKTITFHVSGPLTADDKRSISMTMRRFPKRGIRVSEATMPIKTSEYPAPRVIPVTHDSRPVEPVVIATREYVKAENKVVVETIENTAVKTKDGRWLCAKRGKDGAAHGGGKPFRKSGEGAAYHASWCKDFALGFNK